MTVRNPTGVALVPLLLLLGGSAAAQQAQPMTVKQLEPTSLPRGQTTKVTLIAQGLPNIQSASIDPPLGVKVVEIKHGLSGADGIEEVGIVIAVDANAIPGERTLSVSSPGWDFELTKIRIQDHDIRIADLKVGFPEGEIPAEHAASLRLFSFTLLDDQNDVFRPDARPIGEVNTRTTCGKQELNANSNDLNIGVSGAPATTAPAIREAVPTQVVRRAKDSDKAIGPPPPVPPTMPQGNVTVARVANTGGTTVTFDLPQWAGKGACEVRLSVKDKAGNESNTLRLAVDLK